MKRILFISIVTFLLRIPASAANSTFDFYAQTSENGSLVSQGTNANPITVGAANSGALVIQPTGFSLTAPNAESQIVTFTNIGNGSISTKMPARLSARPKPACTTRKSLWKRWPPLCTDCTRPSRTMPCAIRVAGTPIRATTARWCSSAWRRFLNCTTRLHPPRYFWIL